MSTDDLKSFVDRHREAFDEAPLPDHVWGRIQKELQPTDRRQPVRQLRRWHYAAAATILIAIGIGIGLWWADAVAALGIALSIVKDGVQQLRSAVDDLLDAEAHTHDDKAVHPVVDDVLAVLRDRAWVQRGGIRVRDMGHVFHAELFVVPVGDRALLEQCEELTRAVRALDWKLRDTVVIPVTELPEGVRAHPRGSQVEH